MPKKSPGSTDAMLKELRAFGLTYPDVETKSPWPGHDDLAVNGKTFAYLSAAGEPFHVSFKLPFTGAEALQLAFAKRPATGSAKAAG